VLGLLEANLAAPQPTAGRALTSAGLWHQAVVDPGAYALHTALLPAETPSRRRRHYLEGLIFQLQDEGADSLNGAEKRALLSHRDGLYELHTLLWAAPDGPGAEPPRPAVS